MILGRRLCTPLAGSFLLVVSLTLPLGCAKKKGAETAAPAEVQAADAAAPDDGMQLAGDFESLQRELHEVETGLRSAGVVIPTPEGDREGERPAFESAVGHEEADAAGEGETDTTTVAESRCTRICELAQHACGLQERICDLADRHRGEPRYASVCERAQQDCTRASNACDDCAG